MKYYYVTYIIGDDYFKSSKEKKTVIKKIKAIAKKLKAIAKWSVESEKTINFWEEDKSKFIEI